MLPQSPFVAAERKSLNNREKKDGDIPQLFAKYFDQNLKRKKLDMGELFFSNDAIESAPGPYLIESRRSFVNDNNIWALASIPDCFVWKVKDQKFRNENFYLADMQGYPVKSQTIKLQVDALEATLVLLPKAELKAGQQYFLYLTADMGDQGNRMWIQPIRTL